MIIYRNLLKFYVECSHWYIGSSYETIYVPADELEGLSDHEVWESIRNSVDPHHTYEVCTVMGTYVYDGKECMYTIN